MKAGRRGVPSRSGSTPDLARGTRPALVKRYCQFDSGFRLVSKRYVDVNFLLYVDEKEAGDVMDRTFDAVEEELCPGGEDHECPLATGGGRIYTEEQFEEHLNEQDLLDELLEDLKRRDKKPKPRPKRRRKPE